MPATCLLFDFVFTSVLFLFSAIVSSPCYPGLHLIHLYVLVPVWQGLNAQSKPDGHCNDLSSRGTTGTCLSFLPGRGAAASLLLAPPCTTVCFWVPLGVLESLSQTDGTGEGKWHRTGKATLKDREIEQRRETKKKGNLWRGGVPAPCPGDIGKLPVPFTHRRL